VFFLRDGLAHRVHQHFAPYPYYPDTSEPERTVELQRKEI